MRKLIFLVLILAVAGNVHAEFGDGKLIEKSKEIRQDKMELKDDIKERRETFKVNLKKIKDEKKQKIVEKLDTRFNEVNTQRTAQMTKHLDKMSEILTKIIGDTTSANSAIQVARDAVTVQTAKTYVITISTEDKLKMDVGKVRSQLEADLRAVNELVIAARKAVQVLIK